LNLIKYKQVLKGTQATGNGHQEKLRKELIFRKVPEKEVSGCLDQKWFVVVQSTWKADGLGDQEDQGP
jgi:hypothetical protein